MHISGSQKPSFANNHDQDMLFVSLCLTMVCVVAVCLKHLSQISNTNLIAGILCYCFTEEKIRVTAGYAYKETEEETQKGKKYM